jgi:ADP-ribosyl-[dinitrogen reductase] hydrolase
MILEAAIGDAYGAGFEFQTMEFIQKYNSMTQYEHHGLHEEIYKKYTDDTQMTLAITEALLEHDDWNEEKIANKFVEVFHRDKRRGYSGRVYDALDASTTGKDFIRNIDNRSTGNGSCMRSYPIGYLKDIQQILAFSEIQAKVSHDTQEGIICAKRMALAVHFYQYKIYQQTSLIEFLNETLKENEVYEVIAPIDMHGFPTTKAVIRLVSDYDNMSLCLKDSIDFGGDTDTVASLCMALLSVKSTSINNLPKFLFDELENGKYGRDYLKKLD